MSGDRSVGGGRVAAAGGGLVVPGRVLAEVDIEGWPAGQEARVEAERVLAPGEQSLLQHRLHLAGGDGGDRGGTAAGGDRGRTAAGGDGGVRGGTAAGDPG